MHNYITRHWPWLVPLLALLCIAPFTPALDLAISRFFYGSAEHPFPAQFPLFPFLYTYGEWPGLATGFGGFLLFLGSFIFRTLKHYRKAGLTLALTLAIGAGLISAALLKEHWHRPRPKQTIDFGGNYPYTPFYTYPSIQTTEGLKSFPSGHAMMGFYFLVFIPIGDYYRNRALKLFGLITGLGFGILLSLTRLAQGGHYLSDTIFSAFITWMTILLVSWLVFRK